MIRNINKLYLSATLMLFIGIYMGPTRIKQYVHWIATDPEFFTIPACIGVNCLGKMVACIQNEDCKATLDCTQECQLTQPRNKQAMCAYICEVTSGYLNPEFEAIMLCMIENKCMGSYPQDGRCIAKESDGVKSITSMEQVKGEWWAIKGLNCGETEEFPGGYDGFPCQHERWSLNKDGQWQNNISFCAGKANKCISRGGGAGIKTVANASINSPGVITHSYDSALSPQIERWIIVSHPTPDYMLIYWCGKIPIQTYNGGLLLSRHRSDIMADSVRNQLRTDALKFGLDFDNMCNSDNSWCPDS